MTTILHLTCSPRGRHAESHRLSARIVERLLREAPRALVVERVLAERPPPFIDEAYAVSQGANADVSAEGAMDESESLIRELEAADILVIGTPMHNFTVPAVLKLWIDLVIRARRTFEVTRSGKVGRLRDRPVFVAISSGGIFSGEGARQPDFLTTYLQAALGMAGLRDVVFFSVQGAAGGPEALQAARARVEVELSAHFATCPPWARMAGASGAVQDLMPS
jgi:FMN-dependent NADH-azoreductase